VSSELAIYEALTRGQQRAQAGAAMPQHVVDEPGALVDHALAQR
jgi:hypothetical protein